MSNIIFDVKDIFDIVRKKCQQDIRFANRSKTWLNVYDATRTNVLVNVRDHVTDIGLGYRCNIATNKELNQAYDKLVQVSHQ